MDVSGGDQKWRDGRRDWMFSRDLFTMKMTPSLVFVINSFVEIIANLIK